MVDGELEVGTRNIKTKQEWLIYRYADGKKEQCRVEVEPGTLERMFGNFGKQRA